MFIKRYNFIFFVMLWECLYLFYVYWGSKCLFGFLGYYFLKLFNLKLSKNLKIVKDNLIWYLLLIKFNVVILGKIVFLIVEIVYKVY